METSDRKLAEGRLKEWIESLDKVDAAAERTTLAQLLDKFQMARQGRSKSTIDTERAVIGQPLIIAHFPPVRQWGKHPIASMEAPFYSPPMKLSEIDVAEHSAHPESIEPTATSGSLNAFGRLPSSVAPACVEVLTMDEDLATGNRAMRILDSRRTTGLESLTRWRGCASFYCFCNER